MPAKTSDKAFARNQTFHQSAARSCLRCLDRSRANESNGSDRKMSKRAIWSRTRAVGGKFRWDLTNAEGEKMTMRGEYRELQPGEEDRLYLEMGRRRDLGKSDQHRDGGTRGRRRRH